MNRAFLRERAYARKRERIRKGNFFRYDLLNALSHVSPEEYHAVKLLLTRIGAMLSKLCLKPG